MGHTRSAKPRLAAALLLALASFPGALGSCAAPPPARTISGSERTPEHNAVMEVIEGYYQALSARDWEALGSRFWPGAGLATLRQGQGQDRTRVQTVSIEEYLERSPAALGAQPVFEALLRGAEARVSGPLAQVWARYDARSGSLEAPLRWTGVDAFSLLRHGGQWRIVSIAFAAEP
jgi:hypothetical protein